MVGVAADRRVSGPQTKVHTEQGDVLVKRKDMGVQDMTEISSIVLIVSSEITILTLQQYAHVLRANCALNKKM